MYSTISPELSGDEGFEPASRQAIPITRSLGPEINLFLHDVVIFQPGCAETATAPGRDADLEKGLILARPSDLVCITADTDAAHLDHLAGVGLGPARENIIYLNERTPSTRGLSHAGALLQDEKLLEAICGRVPPGALLAINPFIVTPECLRLAARLERIMGQEVRVSGGPGEIVDTCIQKHAVLEKARELGIPVPRGELVTLDGTAGLDHLGEAIRRHLPAKGAVIIKSAVGVLASQIFTVHAGREGVDEALARIGPALRDSKYLVEVLYDVTLSPNLVYAIGPEPESIRCVGITDQRLSPAFAHQGNAFPSRAGTLPAMLEAGHRLSEWLQSEGYRGITGYDFCEYTDRATGGRNFFLTEINPRINGSVYPLFVQARLAQTCGRPIEAFLSVKWFEVNTHSLTEFRRKFERLFFNPGTMAGIVPYNTGTIGRGIVDLAIMGKNPEEAAGILAAAREAAG